MVITHKIGYKSPFSGLELSLLPKYQVAWPFNWCGNRCVGPFDVNAVRVSSQALGEYGEK